MTPLANRIQAMNDHEVVSFYDHFCQQVFAGINTTLPEITAAMPAEVQALPGMNQLLSTDHSLMAEELSHADAIAVARASLLALAEDAEGSKALEGALEGYQQNEMMAGTILALGAAVSMVYVASSFSYSKEDGVKIDPGNANLDLIKALVAPVTKAVEVLVKKSGGATKG